MKPKAHYFFDPSKLTSGEKIYYEKIRSILHGLLNDLKNERCLRRATSLETNNFIEIMKDKDEIALAFNRLQDLFSIPTMIEEFIERNKDHFDDRDMLYLLMSQLYFLSLVHVEMFRNMLLFYLRRGRSEKFHNKMTLGKFIHKLKEVSPVYGEKIEAELESIIRNSFAHGLFKIETHAGDNPLLLCYESVGELDNPTKITLTELMIKRKNLNIIYMTLASLIAEKMQEGSFR